MSVEKSEELAACAQICLDCSRACAQTLSGCLKKGGNHAEFGHVQELIDCLFICQTAASFLLRGSNSCAAICATCAEICEKCAVGCEGWEDDQIEQCAQECRSCCEACKSLV